MTIALDKISRAARSLPEWAITHWPGGVGRRLREAYWRARLGAMGEGCIIVVGVVIGGAEHIFLGDNVWIDAYTVLLAGPSHDRPNLTTKPNPAYRFGAGEMHIGSNTHIAPFCVLQAHGGLSIGKDSGVGAHSSFYSLSNHYRAPGRPERFDGHYDRVIKYSPLVPPEQQAYISSPIVMEDASGVGVGSVVLPGSIVRRYSWVGVGSVVRGEVPPGVIAGGNPLKILKQRFGEPLTGDDDGSSSPGL
jgi:acetyltransferase-like isoleucine patch superfamily enzyme